MVQPTSEYTDRTRKFVEKTGGLAVPVARELGVSPTAIVGAVANEYDTRKNVNRGKQAFADWWADRGSYRKYSKQKIKPTGGHPTIPEKLRDRTKIDIGPGNIRVDTAIDLVQRYVQRHSGSGKDPLKLLKYKKDYDRLIDDLLEFDHPETSYAVAGLYLAQGKRLFRRMSNRAWDNLPPDQQDALLVTYYKLGEEQIARNIERRFAARGRPPKDFAFNPRGDGGQQHLNNVDNLKKWLKRRRVDYPAQ